MKGAGKRFFLVSIFFLLLDQITKTIVLGYISLGETVNVAGDLFVLRLVGNTGAGFGILKDQNNVLIVITIMVIVLIVYYLKDMENTIIETFTALILSGAAGNLIDRLRFGYVIDFLDFGIGSLRWPTFNVADSAIVIGAIGLGYYWWKEEESKNK